MLAKEKPEINEDLAAYINEEQQRDIENHQEELRKQALQIQIEKKKNEVYFVDVFHALLKCDIPNIQI